MFTCYVIYAHKIYHTSGTLFRFRYTLLRLFREQIIITFLEMELISKSKDWFQRRNIVKGRQDLEVIEGPSTKWKLMQWELANRNRSESNNEALEKEMEETLGEVNSFLHKLDITSMVYMKCKSGKHVDWSKFQAFDRKFKEQVVLGHTVMGKVKDLLDLENNSIDKSSSDKSLSNKSSISGMGYSWQESLGNLSTSSRYSSDISDVLRKFNHILKKKDIPLPSQIKEHDLLDKDMENLFSRQDALKFLTGRLAKENIQPVFVLNPQKPSDSFYTVVCRVFNMTVEGKASEKIAAKKDSAVKMLELLVEKSSKNCIPPQITPLSEFEQQEAIGILCESERYDAILNDICVERRKLSPRYQIDTGKQWMQIHCYALGLKGTGTHMNSVVAKRAAARDILVQFKDRPKYQLLL